jgi:riboflavin synthase
MFTGIIEQTGTIEALDLRDGAGRLRVRFGVPASACAPLALGASIAVNGCCLTAIDPTADSFSADLSGETLALTSFDELKPGAIVNLERPLTAGAELGGHFVQGHVDAVGRVRRLALEAGNWWLAVHVPDSISRYVVTKGSITIDGVSLTVARWQDGVAEIAVIPHTYAQTNVRQLLPGGAVNLEADILAKYMERLLLAREKPIPSHLSIEELSSQGF